MMTMEDVKSVKVRDDDDSRERKEKYTMIKNANIACNSHQFVPISIWRRREQRRREQWHRIWAFVHTFWPRSYHCCCIQASIVIQFNMMTHTHTNTTVNCIIEAVSNRMQISFIHAIPNRLVHFFFFFSHFIQRYSIFRHLVVRWCCVLYICKILYMSALPRADMEYDLVHVCSLVTTIWLSRCRHYNISECAWQCGCINCWNNVLNCFLNTHKNTCTHTNAHQNDYECIEHTLFAEEMHFNIW